MASDAGRDDRGKASLDRAVGVANCLYLSQRSHGLPHPRLRATDENVLDSGDSLSQAGGAAICASTCPWPCHQPDSHDPENGVEHQVTRFCSRSLQLRCRRAGENLLSQKAAFCSCGAVLAQYGSVQAIRLKPRSR